MDEVVKKVGKNTIWQLIGKTISTILSIILVFLIARTLGPTSYGVFSLVVTFLFLFQQFTSAGLEPSLPYFMQKYKDKSTSLLKTYFKSRIIITLTCALIFYLLSDYIALIYNNPSLSSYIKLISLFVPFFILMNASYQIFQGFNDLKQSMKVDIVFSICKYLALTLIILGFGIYGGLIGYGISYIITTIFAFNIIYKRFWKKSSEFRQKKELMNYATTIFISGIFMFLSYYLINLILGLNPIELGFFDSANKVGLLISIIPSAIAAALTPSITNKTKQEIKNIVRTFTKYAMIAMIPIITILLFTPGFVINTLLSTDYDSIVSFFSILVIALTIQSLTLIYDSISYGIGKPKNAVLNYVVRTFMIILLSGYLTNAFNASWVLLTAVSVSTIIVSIQLRKYLQVPWASIIKTIISVIPLGLALYIDIDLTLKIVIASGATIIYGILIYKSVLNNKDKSLIKALTQKILRTTKNI